jgi:hypothetical protein
VRNVSAAEHPLPGPRLFEGPVLLRGTRRNVAELIGLAWLALEIVRLLRSRRESPSPVSPPWDLAASLPRRHSAPDGGT